MKTTTNSVNTSSIKIQFIADKMGGKTFIDSHGFIHPKQDWLSLTDSFVQESGVKNIYLLLEYPDGKVAHIKDLMLAIYENDVKEVERLLLFWINELGVDYDTRNLQFILNEIKNENDRKRRGIRTGPDKLRDALWAKEKVQQLIKGTSLN